MKPRSHPQRQPGWRPAVAGAVLLLGAAFAQAQAQPQPQPQPQQQQQQRQSPVEIEGGYLTGRNGMSLYIYDQDPVAAHVSMCRGPCTTIWPPLTAGADDRDFGDFTIIERGDGSLQWAYKGKPLYFYARDPGPNARAGTDANRAWHPARR